MAENSFLLKVYSPAGLVLEESVASATLPAEEGEIGVFPLHARYIGTLGTGILRFETAGGDRGAVVISGGFARMTDGQLHLLTDYVVTPDEADSIDSSGERERLERLVATGDTNAPEHTAALVELHKVQAVEELKHINH